MEWPTGLTARPLGIYPAPLTARRQASRFRAPLSKTATALRVELRHLRARDTVLRVDIGEGDIRIDGAPYARARAATPAIVLQFETPDGALAFPCDRFETWQENLRAIALGLTHLRRLDDYGITSRHEQYTGWRALEAGGSEDARPFHDAATAIAWMQALLVDEFGAQVRSWEHVALARRALRFTHPDMGGNATDHHLVREAADLLGITL